VGGLCDFCMPFTYKQVHRYPWLGFIGSTDQVTLVPIQKNLGDLIETRETPPTSMQASPYHRLFWSAEMRCRFPSPSHRILPVSLPTLAMRWKSSCYPLGHQMRPCGRFRRSQSDTQKQQRAAPRSTKKHQEAPSSNRSRRNGENAQFSARSLVPG